MTHGQRSSAHEDTLPKSLDRLLADLDLAISSQRTALQQLRDQWHARQIRVVVLGEAKRGKSSLINALAGRPLLPTGVLPVTSVVTVVRKDPRRSLVVTYQDGRTALGELDTIAEYVTDERNPANLRRISSVEVLVPDLPWPASVLVVDTPGTGSVDGRHDQVASDAEGTMDVGLMVLTSDPPVSAREQRLIEDAASQAAELLVAINKSDLLSDDDLEVVVGYTRDVVAKTIGRPTDVIAVSTKNAAFKPHPGLSQIRDLVTSLATDPERHTLARSIRTRARRLIQGERDEVAVRLSLARLASAQAPERAALFTLAIDEARGQYQDCADVVSAGIRRLNAALDRSCGSEIAILEETLLREVERLADGRRIDRETEADFVAAMTMRATEHAESWRQKCAEQVQRDLEAIGQRATAIRGSALAQLRASAHELLGVDLAMALESISLPSDPRFFYLGSAVPDAASALATLVRRQLPPTLRRRAASMYLRDRAILLADRQLGRARGDLRQRLVEAERLLLAEVGSAMNELLDRLEHAAETALGTTREQRLLDEREREWARAADLLDEALRWTSDSPAPGAPSRGTEAR